MWNDTDFNSTFSSPSAGGKEIKVTKPFVKHIYSYHFFYSFFIQKNLIKHILPVTAYTINACQQVEGENSVYTYNGVNFHQVSFIGIVRSVIKRANDTTYLVDDMSSTEINVKLQSDVSNISSGLLVKIFI